METTNEALLALARSSAAQFVALDARIDAAMGFAAGLAMRGGMTETEASEALRKCSAMAYEKALHKLEDKDPGLAADLDLRWPADFSKF